MTDLLETAALPQDMFDPKALQGQLETENPISCCKAAIARATEYQHARFREGAQASALIHQRAQFVDELLGLLWDRQGWESAPLALVAVGGYGRGELHPHSDVDVLILQGGQPDDYRESLAEFTTFLWDIGLNPGYSVRTVDECVDQARNDITVLTNLMETRVLRGDATLLDTVRNRTGPSQMWPSSDFFKAKLEEQRVRHARFADTESNLEPNVKSSPGGLRDLQVIGWITERHFGVDSLEQVAAGDFLTEEEIGIISRGRDFMWQVRYALHMITDREEDRLLFDHQRELAALWGHQDGDRLAVEQFMQVFYRWALALAQLNEVIIQYFDQAILRQDTADDVREINERFEVRNGYVAARYPELFHDCPSALLEVFLLCVNDENIEGVAAPTIRLIRDCRHLVDDAFRADERNKQTFLAILRGPHKMTRQLRRMLRYGILGRYLPEFGQIIGQMQHDLFHVYTVDAHTLEVIKFARRFMYPGMQENLPVSSRVARRLDNVELLYIAALYHDIGKGRGGDHSELGAVDAERFCVSHGLNEKDTELVVWLVRNHLLMSAIAQRKDISDPKVVQEFAEHVGDERHLNYLFTLTVADINATNPTLWNAWRGSLLRQLFSETRRALRRGLDNPVEKSTLINKTRDSAIEILEGRGFTSEELDEVWQARDDDYFVRERPEDIAWHTEAIADHVDRDQPLVLVHNSAESSVANTTQIFIHARSRPSLFSRVCAALEHLELSVHDARIYSATNSMSLETFFVLDSDGQSIAEDGDRLKQIRDFISHSLESEDSEPGIIERHTPRQMKSFFMPTETSMSIDETKNLSVLEVATPDRPGLLARIGRIFVRYNIELQGAKIQTLGERVEDVFFITDQSQQAIRDPQLREAIQQTIREELDEQAAA
ncbi:MAG: [protein-PII] uridylyltransferase [Halioglobus sp.]